MNDVLRILVQSTPGLSAEEARDARARAWRYIFDCCAKKAARNDGGEDAQSSAKDDSHVESVPRSAT